MKAVFIFSLGLLLTAGVYAQQPTQRKGVVIQPGNQQQDTSGQTNLPASGRRSTASWRYHRGTKRPQVKVQELPEHMEERQPEPGEKSDSTKK